MTPDPAAAHDAGPRPWEWLYEVVGLGMWALTRARFGVQVVGPVPRVELGQLWIATHRAETDVPLVGGLLTVRGGMWRGGAARLHFAARDDLFTPGVVSAGLRLPPIVARAAWSLTPGTWLPRVRAHPIRRPVGLKLSQVVRDLDPGVPLQDVLAPHVVATLRAADGERRAPMCVRDIRTSASARELWQDVTRDDLTGAQGAAVWRRHVARAAGDLRRLVSLVRRGEPLMLFPEGRVSADGGIGPIGGVLDVVARRGAPASILPIGIAYDPLTRGRTKVAIAVGPPILLDGGPLGDRALARLRRATPITVGQIVARELAAIIDEGGTTVDRRRLLEAMARIHDLAGREGRPVVPGLGSPGRRGRGLASALHALVARGLVSGAVNATMTIRAEAVRTDPVLLRLAHEDRAVWHADTTVSDP